ncbi:MAG: DUF21 domain-containing protein [Kiritimatiellae bacterium]|nr:DUF21 domain-containing protein [Kiritimatiellia bacterium]
MIVSALLALAMLAALAAAAFCAGAETGFFSVRRGRVLHLARSGSRAAKTIADALSDMGSTLTALLVGNNLANVVFSSASAALSTRCFPGSAFARTVWGVAAAFVVLYLCEFLPKLFASARPLRRMLAVAPVYRLFASAMSPLTRCAMAVTGLFVPSGEAKYKVSTADLLRILQDRKDGVRLTDFESALISRILVMRRKGEFITVESLLRAIDEEES